MHEQSETVERGGRWFNVYGSGTPKAGRVLPGEPERGYDTLDEAVNAARERSKRGEPEPPPPSGPRKSELDRGRYRAGAGTAAVAKLDPDDPKAFAAAVAAEILGGEPVKPTFEQKHLGPSPYAQRAGSITPQAERALAALNLGQAGLGLAGGRAGALGARPTAAGRVSATPAVVRQYRQSVKQAQGASDPYMAEVLRGPLWHGTPATGEVMKRGFDVGRAGAESGLKLGEATGVSVTSDPRVAQQFGTPKQFVRVGASLKPAEILPAYTPEGAKELRTAYKEALDRVTFGPDQARSVFAKILEPRDVDALSSWMHTREKPTSVADAFGWLKQRYPDVREDAPIFSDAAIGRVNRELTKVLQERGRQAILYSPQRWGERELRVLDAARVMPLETRASPTTAAPQAEPIPMRYYQPIAKRGLSAEAWSGRPETLHDIYGGLSGALALP